MRHSRVHPGVIFLLLAASFATTRVEWCWAQQTAAKPVSTIAADKFAFGKTMYIKNEHGSDAAYDVIASDIQGWAHFEIVNSPDKAQIIAEVTSYEAGSVRAGTNTDYATPDGKPIQSSGANKDLSGASVNLKLYDTKTRRELWSGSERVKGAFKKKTEEDNLVASAEKLFLRFHDYVEPPAK